MEKQESFFDFAAEVGLTKHIGGLEATITLMELCHVGPDSYVLDVGCGVGATPCFIARKYGCRVMGVDILDAMVARSRQRVEKEGLAGQVEIRQADAQKLPFKDGTFDAVFTESVTAFPKDKQKAVREYARVTKKGGFIGLNESTWLKTPVPKEMLAWISQDLGASARPELAGDWVALLKKAGLKEVSQQLSGIRVSEESKGLVKRYGCGGALGIFTNMFRLYLRNPNYRAFVRASQKGGVVPENLDAYFGYGLYVGRKP